MPLRSKTPPDPQRQLMIKVKACQRMIKEVAYYEQEVKENEATLEAMKVDASKDPYDIKKFKEVLGESYMMIPDSQSRLQRALTDLEEYVASPEVTEDDTLTSSSGNNEWYLQATELLTTQQRKGQGTTASGGDDDDDGDVKETDVGGLEEGEVF
mmetsp:Transcript_67601/g.101904  ORF Transcript_67601/g.101904 Transcript_67601/m.101904 type:complete len:155 (+) Transcript_67601:59-523(+)